MEKFIDHGIMLILAGTILLSHPGQAQEAQQPPREMAQFFIGMIYKGDVWGSFSQEEAATIQRGHRANIQRLEQAGKLVLAGPVDSNSDLRGIFIYNTSTLEEAQELVNTDPAVRAGRLRIELFPMWAPSALAQLPRM